MEEQVKSMNFFKKFWTSIKDFEKYEEFAAESLGKAIKYMLIITLLFTLVITIAYTYKFYLTVKDVRSYIENNIEEISYTDGKLNVKSDEKIEIISENNIIPAVIVDTSEEANIDENLKKIEPYQVGIVFSSDKAIVQSSFLAENETIYYSDILENDISNKEELLEMISFSNASGLYFTFFFTILIYLFAVYFSSNIVDAIVLGVLGYIFARIVRLRLKYRACFNIGVYALTLPILLNLIYVIINTYTGFEISHFQWMYTSISYIYVAVAILMIKTEIINQKIQLIRLREIEKQAKEETIEKPDEEKEKSNEDKEEKKEDKKEEKEDKKPRGEEPEGSNA